jgi:uncharacterized protein
MDPLVPYTLPLKGLKNGIHTFHFQIGRDFFEHFEESPLEDGHFDLQLEVDKRPDLLVLDFDFAGKAFTECDRCLADIQLPVKGQNRLLVKFTEDDGEDEADVFYLDPEVSSFKIAQFVYEYICLALPMIKVYDCEKDVPKPCDEEMLKYLKKDSESEENNNPFKEALKNLNKISGN